ncbi:DUF7689 domain-containing protein [Chondromyces crocatus]|nr:hypothetical protein [Chondromyces crocatus]
MLEVVFPDLSGWDYEVTSEITFDYNCIAFAAGDESSWWWPTHPEGYWPPEAPRECTLEAFIKAYETLGYHPCDDDSHDPAFDKVALYADEKGTPTHAALQIDGLYWKSKLGKLHDIKHPLNALVGSSYGRVVAFLRRARPTNL